jgi:HEPN domain-containing protein
MNAELLKEAGRWLRQAESDYNFLEVARKSGKHDVTCFLSQQVAEKALKAYLFSQGEEAVFPHAIFKLCEIASQYDQAFSQLRDRIKTLDYFYVEARYPNAIEDVIPADFFNEKDAQEAISLAQQTLDFLRKRLSSVLKG